MQHLILKKVDYFIENAKFIISGSKSISQRALIINDLMNFQGEIQNLSDSSDTFHMNNCLSSSHSILDVGNAGTTLRFLIPFFALKNKEVILTGDSYLFNRPITPLIHYLNNLGANISKCDNKIYIRKGDLKGGDLYVNIDKTSQFISALLLIAPYLDGGLKLNFSCNPNSYSYILMTLKIMNYCGVDVSERPKCIIVPNTKYIQPYLKIESDWSSASYLYLSFLFSKLQCIEIASFNNNSFQPDSILVSFFTICGINSFIDNNILILRKNNNIIMPNKIDWDFSNNPDFSLTVFVACAGLRIDLCANGIDTLFYKESNRIVAMQKELSKFNCQLSLYHDIVYLKNKKHISKDQMISIDTYNDHRIALAFSPLVLLGYNLKISKPNVIFKSYPNFFNDLVKFGVEIEK